MLMSRSFKRSAGNILSLTESFIEDLYPVCFSCQTSPWQGVTCRTVTIKGWQISSSVTNVGKHMYICNNNWDKPNWMNYSLWISSAHNVHSLTVRSWPLKKANKTVSIHAILLACSGDFHLISVHQLLKFTQLWLNYRIFNWLHWKQKPKKGNVMVLECNTIPISFIRPNGTIYYNINNWYFCPVSMV